MDNWRASYDSLQRYAAEHPTIEINSNGTSIPGDVRVEFYRLFDAVLATYVKDTFAAQISEASLASAKYSEAKAALTACLNLNVEVNPNLGWFLQDPVSGLTRHIFTLLLSLMMNKIDVAGFEQSSYKIIQEFITGSMREIYLSWTGMSLIRLLGPDQAYSVPVPDETRDPHYRESDLRPGQLEDIPSLVPADKLSLFSSHYVPLLPPKLIFHSSRLNTFVAIRTDFHRVYTVGRRLHEIIKNMEWYKIGTLTGKFGAFNLWPDIGVYLDDNPEQLRVIADYNETLHPDMIIDVLDAADWNKNGGLEMARRHYEVLQPRKDMFVTCRIPLPQKNTGETPSGDSIGEDAAEPGVLNILPSNMHVLEVGYEADKLQPVIACLSESKSIACPRAPAAP